MTEIAMPSSKRAIGLADVPGRSATSGAEADRLPGPISWDLPEGSPVALEDDPDITAGTPAGATAAGAPAGEGAPGLGVGSVTPWTEDLAPTAVEVRSRPVRRTADWSLGPVGRRRSVALLVLVSVMTLGLGAVAWMRRANREMVEFDPRMQARPGRTAVAIGIPVVLTLLVAAAAAARVVGDHSGLTVDLPLAPSVTRWLVAAPLVAPWLCLLLPMSAIAAVMTVERVRVAEDRVGLAPDLQVRPVATLGWLLVPLVGVVVLAAAVQRRLNRVWEIAVP